MARDDRLTAGQMLDLVVRIRAIVRGQTRESFETDEVRQLALLHLIQILGEAASRPSAAFREGHPELPWTQMIAMRNRIVHGYDHVDPDIVWRVATDDTEALLAALERIVSA
ncbi:MAG: DUF86 domain-containing protein [Gemmatimonadetes bacterium]|nr:DUF86 domain-containing protein [Gemmatimonadota bacterium]